ncbi:MAG: metal-dependent hydrolase [SAR324 cluster bacterium]|nr:metal-dependent hydrolase [SAR324 cluster bacterium]
MTPISHSFFGFTTGFILSPINAKFGVSRRKTVLFCTIGAIVPDIDAIWLKIDGSVYYGLNWYSHHALTHSVAGALLLSLLFMILFQSKLTYQSFRKKTAIRQWISLFLVLCIGCLMHLPGDMVTFPGPWKGIPLWAPFSWKRFGGWSYIPWKDY